MVNRCKSWGIFVRGRVKSLASANEALRCFPKMADLPYTEDDIQRMLACQVHLGTKNCDFQMEKYTYKRRANDGEKPDHHARLFLRWA